MRQKNSVLRIYNVYISGMEEEGGLAFAAYTSQDAKRFAWNDSEMTVLSFDYPDLRPHWIRGARADNLIEGQRIPLIDGLRRGVYSDSVCEETCPICGKKGFLYGENGLAGCRECLDAVP